MPDGCSVSRRIFVMGSLGSALAAGCGGGNTPSGSPLTSSSGQGAAQFTILWPELKPDSRLIPAAAKSITITLVGPVTVTKTVARPAAGTNQTTVSFPDLEIGSYTATATAYPNADGTGTAQATGTVSVTITKNQTTTASLTMGTTITKVEVSPTSFTVPTTGTVNLTATARDASNAIVLTGSTWSWSSSDPSKATVAGITTSATVTGVASGSTTITATETESGKSGSSAGSVGFNQGEGLAASSWPRDGANQWNTFYTPVSGNTSGVEQWSVLGAPGGAPVVDDQGNIYFSGFGKVHKVTPSGSASVFFNMSLASEFAYSIAIDKAGNIIFSEGSKVHSIAKNGTINWVYTITTPPTTVNSINRSINIDKNNNYYLNFSFSSPAAPPSPRIYSISSLGNLNWQANGGTRTTISADKLVNTGHFSTYWFNIDGSLIPGGFVEDTISIAQKTDQKYQFVSNAKFGLLDQNRNKLWEINSTNSFLGVIPDGRVIIDGSRCYDSSGTLLWTAKDGQPLFGRMAISTTTMYVASGSNAKGLYAVNLTDGSILWKKTLAFSSFDPPQPVLGPDGTVYIIFNNKLTAYR